MTKLQLLEHVNRLNISSPQGYTYWTVIVLYNHVIWERDNFGNTTMVHVIGKLDD